MKLRAALLMLLVALGFTACGVSALLPEQAGFGTRPNLPPPETSWIPTVNIAPAVGWPEGHSPTAAAGLRVTMYAKGLDHPRWLSVLPNGDVLVAETNGPPKAEGANGILGRIMGFFMKRAGAATPSANRITLLRDTNADGVADARFVLLEGLNSPFGIGVPGGSFVCGQHRRRVAFSPCPWCHGHHAARHQTA
jgi:glucose/arabinose dehydrogenase